MCVQSQTLSPAKHFLLSAYGARWKEIDLAMFTVYVDDSGTSPDQKIALAAALVVPGRRIDALESEWENLKRKYRFTDLHASECAARNDKTQFARWDDDKVAQVFGRTCEISKKYSVKAISYALRKTDYDATLSDDQKRIGGKYHYTWAVRWLIRQLSKWHRNHSPQFPLEFVFDWPEKKAKEEIERVMAQEERAHPGRYEKHYLFRHRDQLAGLQCADMLAWSSYQGAQGVLENLPFSPFAMANWVNYRCHHRIPNWIEIFTDKGKEDLAETFSEDESDPATCKRRNNWFEEYKSARKKQGKTVPGTRL
jgi:hypothetical protein